MRRFEIIPPLPIPPRISMTIPLYWSSPIDLFTASMIWINILHYHGNPPSVDRTFQITMEMIASQYQAAIASVLYSTHEFTSQIVGVRTSKPALFILFQCGTHTHTMGRELAQWLYFIQQAKVKTNVLTGM
jgi:hypothetical protein